MLLQRKQSTTHYNTTNLQLFTTKPIYNSLQRKQSTTNRQRRPLLVPAWIALLLYQGAKCYVNAVHLQLIVNVGR